MFTKSHSHCVFGHVPAFFLDSRASSNGRGQCYRVISFEPMEPSDYLNGNKYQDFFPKQVEVFE